MLPKVLDPLRLLLLAVAKGLLDIHQTFENDFHPRVEDKELFYC
jgi:hypothetical protein